MTPLGFGIICRVIKQQIQSEVAIKGIAKIKLFVKSSFEEQFTVASWLSKSLIENTEKLML